MSFLSLGILPIFPFLLRLNFLYLQCFPHTFCQFEPLLLSKSVPTLLSPGDLPGFTLASKHHPVP